MTIPDTIHRMPPQPAGLTRWVQGVRASNAASWLAAVVLIGLPFVAANIVVQRWMPDAGLRDLRNLLKALVLMLAYVAYVRCWERRPVRELSASGAAGEIGAGLMLGSLLFSCVVALLFVAGAYSVEAVGTRDVFGSVLASMAPKVAAGALIEEVLFRLVLLRLLVRLLGVVWALVASSLVFGLAHLGNAGATPLIGVLLGVELGVLFGAAYLLTRRLWLCAALHFAWNFVQGAVFSIAVSGHTGEAWLRGTLSGPAWLSGGAFGAEGSVVSVVLCLAAAGVLLTLAHRRGRLDAAASS
ncbi:CPBP family intramembrane glutamic endopeptidase [Roseateles sp. BYS96W]|uniref:CPBP family intramembrane glutamic endopeptidase n=1 Tax=Pelomonas nitida TaxID=3299027 RepID=A0ABW7GCK2_9BURK